ncbi:MAG: hypothetical protein PWP05_310 [Thermovirga sp.]|nr:hypothetical protein [Thermovirga sp.]
MSRLVGSNPTLSAKGKDDIINDRYELVRNAEKWPSGRRRALGERLSGNAPGVRIPPSPPFLI